MLRCRCCVRQSLQTFYGQPISVGILRTNANSRYAAISTRSASNVVEGGRTNLKKQTWTEHLPLEKNHDFKNNSSSTHRQEPKFRGTLFTSQAISDAAITAPRSGDFSNPPIYQLPGREISVERIRRASVKERAGDARKLNAGAKMHQSLLGDPLKLADAIRGLLQEDKFEEAQEIVRAASKSLVQFTVSWNHLIDWQMAQGSVNKAMKTYQEMKKRQQVPDAFTYTILLRALADHAHYPQALSKALSIYHSMSADNSPVKPTIIHTNAALKVCARAGDMDAMFGIAAKLRPTGMNAPNNLTFTTILNAIRQNALEIPSGRADPETLQPRRNKAIMDARLMWDDIVRRWRKGDIWVDEELVCSMGRILLMGDRKDVDDIFSLVEQTMNIPRLVPRFGSQARARIEPSLQGRSQPDIVSTETSTKLAVPIDEFKTITPPNRSQNQNGYATPGPNTLSLVLEALQKSHSRGPLVEYWELFTIEHKVLADSQNFHSYLRNLRLFRASTETVKLAKDMPKEMLGKKTFRIAMSTCLRDKNNPAAFANAGKILDLMQTNLADLDISALESYLEVAMTSPAHSKTVRSDDLPVPSKYAQGRQISRALDRLGPSVINLKSALSYGTDTTSELDHARKGRKPNKSEEEKDSVLKLLRRMVSAYDQLMMKGMVERNFYSDLAAPRSKLAAFITRHKRRYPTDDKGVRIRESSSEKDKMRGNLDST